MTTPAPSALLVARARYARSFVPSALVRIASSPPAPPDIGGRRARGISRGREPRGGHKLRPSCQKQGGPAARPPLPPPPCGVSKRGRGEKNRGARGTPS